MIKKLIYINLLFIGMLSAVVVETDKDLYANNQQVVVTFSDVTAKNHDWIGIYPAGSTNDWGNQVQWDWTGDKEAGTATFSPLAEGVYDVRLFYNNSFTLEASKQITVDANGAVATVTTSKAVYLPEEPISAIFDNMSGDAEDWIAVYPAGSSSDWGNQLDWKWIAGDISGQRAFDALPAGDYEVRTFLHNSFNVEASANFTVEAPDLGVGLVLSENIYDPSELIKVDYNNMRGVASDWIGIFAVGANNEKESALEWRDTKSLVNGPLSFAGLPAGTYQMRAFFDNTLEKTVGFTVQDIAVTSVLYDDFEDGVIDPRWVRAAGPDMTLQNVGVNDMGVHTELQSPIAGQHSLRTYRDYRNGLNYSGYYFDFENPDSKLKFLEVDMRIGVSSHVFAFGVKVKTKLGDRRIEFASWLNHTLPSGQQIISGPYGNVLEGHREAFTQDNYLHVHPGPTDYYIGTRTGDFVHYKINIEEKLRVLEPDNELLGITLFTTSGGDYDNLKLVSH